MYRIMYGAFCAVAFICLSTVNATPSTQIWIPSTDIQGFLKPHIGWDVYLATKENSGFKTITNGGLTIGILPFSKVGMEVGIDYRDLSGDHHEPLYFNAKLGTQEDVLLKYMPAIAVGGYDFGTSATKTSYNLLYGLVAKTLPKIGRFSFGGYTGAVGGEKSLFTVASNITKTDDAGLLASWDRTMVELTNKLWLAIDYQGGKNGYGALSFGAAWVFAPNISMIVGYDIFNDADTYKPSVTIQFDINVW